MTKFYCRTHEKEFEAEELYIHSGLGCDYSEIEEVNQIDDKCDPEQSAT